VRIRRARHFRTHVVNESQLRLWSDDEHELIFLEALCVYINSTPGARVWLSPDWHNKRDIGC
jgi:hypothetical protein